MRLDTNLALSQNFMRNLLANHLPAMHNSSSNFRVIQWCLATSLQTFTSVGNCILVGYYVANSGNSLPTFQGHLSVPSSRVQVLRSWCCPLLDHLPGLPVLLWILHILDMCMRESFIFINSFWHFLHFQIVKQNSACLGCSMTTKENMT